MYKTFVQNLHVKLAVDILDFLSCSVKWHITGDSSPVGHRFDEIFSLEGNGIVSGAVTI